MLIIIRNQYWFWRRQIRFGQFESKRKQVCSNRYIKMYLCSLMEYQILRNRERASWIDEHYVERGSLADFTDKIERTEQIHSMCCLVSWNFNLKKSVIYIITIYLSRTKFRQETDNSTMFLKNVNFYIESTIYNY